MRWAPGWPRRGEDDVPELPVTPYLSQRDLGMLGAHRLILRDMHLRRCVRTGFSGDCESPSLMVTIPPYASEYDSQA